MAVPAETESFTSNNHPFKPELDEFDVLFYPRSQQMLNAFLELKEPVEDYVFISRDISAGTGKKDFAFIRADRLEVLLESLDEVDRCLYSIEINKKDICQKRKLKVDFDLAKFLDVDKTQINPDFTKAKELGSFLASQLRAEMIDTFKALWPEQVIHENNVLLFNSCSEDKISWHAVLDGYCVADQFQAREFVRRLKARPWEWGRFVDTAPYSSFQSFRLPRCHKLGKDNRKRIGKLSDGSLPPFLVCITTWIKGCTDLAELPIETRRKIESVDVGSETAARVMEMFNSIEDFSDKWVLRSVNDGMLVLKQLDDCWCPLCDRDHDGRSDNNSLFLTVDSESGVTLRCRRYADEGGKGGQHLFNVETGEFGDRPEAKHKRLLPQKVKGTAELIFEDIDDAKEKTETEGYFAMKDRFERHHFKCLEDAMFYDTSDSQVIRRTKEKMIIVYQHLKYSVFAEDGSCKRVPFLKRWLNDEKMRIHKNVRLIPPPSSCPEETYNLWRGMAVWKVDLTDRDPSPEERDDCKFLMDHLYKLANKEDDIFAYLKSWIAYFLQNPGLKPRVMILIKSLEGLGKQLGLYTPLANIIGRQYCLITQRAEQEILGPFNAQLENKLLVVLDEMSLGTAVKYEAQAKEMITRETDFITPKGVDTREVPSFGHYMSFSNRDFPWTISDTDRRYFAIDASSQDPLDADYFTRLARVGEDMRVLRLFYDEMMAIKLEEWDPRTSRPETEFGQVLKTVSRPLDLQFIIEYLDGLTENTTISAKDLYVKFLNYTVEQGVPENAHKITAIKFGMKLGQLKIDGWEKVKIDPGVMSYKVDFNLAQKWLKTKGFVKSPVRLIPKAK
jgi:hypothetical protein